MGEQESDHDSRRSVAMDIQWEQNHPPCPATRCCLVFNVLMSFLHNGCFSRETRHLFLPSKLVHNLCYSRETNAPKIEGDTCSLLLESDKVPPGAGTTLILVCTSRMVRKTSVRGCGTSKIRSNLPPKDINSFAYLSDCEPAGCTARASITDKSCDLWRGTLSCLLTKRAAEK